MTLESNCPSFVLLPPRRDGNRRTCLVSLSVVTVLLWCALASHSRAADPQVVRIGVESNAPPLSFVNNQGHSDGFTTELLTEMSKVGIVRFEIVPGSWKFIKAEFLAGRLEALADVTTSDERWETMDFSIEHAHLHAISYTRPESLPMLQTSQFRGKKMAMRQGSVAETRAAKLGGWGAKIVSFQSMSEALEAVKHGECDFALFIQSLTYVQISELGLRRGFVDDVIYPFHIAVHQGNRRTLMHINEALATVRHNGTFDRIYTRWIGPLEPHPIRLSDLRPYAWPIALLTLAIGAILFWQQQVKLRVVRYAKTLETMRAILMRTGRIAKVGGWELDTRTNLLTWTEETCLIHEVDPRFKPDPEKALSFFEKGDRSVIQAAIQAAIESGTPIDLELPLTTAKLRPIWVRIQGSAKLEDGRTVAIQGSFQDISVHKEQEREIALLNQMYSTSSRISQAIVRTRTKEELLSEICQILVKQGGFKLAWVGQLETDTKLIKPIAIAGDDQSYLAGIRISTDPAIPEGRGSAGTAFREHKTYVSNDISTDPAMLPWQAHAAQHGIKCALSLSFCLEGNDMGVLTVYSGEKDHFLPRTVSLMEGAAIDLSFRLGVFALEAERQQTKAKLRQLSRIVEQAPLSVVITDLNGAIEYVNQKFCNVTGYTQEEVRGKNPRVLKSGETPAETYVDMWQTIGNGRTWSGDLINRKKNGELYRETAIVAPVINSFGKTTHFVAIKDDITAQKRFEVEAHDRLMKEREISEMKSRFISITSHEFRTPMASIQVAADLLRGHFQDLAPEKRNDLFARIDQSVRRITGMLDDILLLNRMDIDRGVVRIATLNLKMLAHDIVEEFRLTDHGTHTFDFGFEAESPFFVTDSNLFRHILSNLLSNAVRYSPANTLITVRIEVDQWRLKLSVEDQGIGIPPDEMLRIFDPFERGSNVGLIKGNGLGLNIVKRMTEALGGMVGADNVAGRGARFTVILPRKQPPEKPL